jgi:hypothetical protein
MNSSLLLPLLVSLVFPPCLIAAEVPAQPIAKKAAPAFSDDFERTKVGDAWKTSVGAFSITNGVLVGSQKRADHGAVGAVKIGTLKNCIAEFKFRFEGATSINAVWDDKNFKGSHAGHICRVAITPKQIRLGDDKEGVMNNAIFEMRKDPKRKAEADKLLVGRGQAINLKIEPKRWYQLTAEIIDDQMRVSLDGKAIGWLKSPGLAHATKDTFHFTINGNDAWLDDVKVWAAEPAASK